jgi:hypothetical protein
MTACGKKETPQSSANENPKPSAVSALGKSKAPTSSYPRMDSRRYDPAKATTEQIAARERLEQRLADAAVEKEERDAARAVERTQRIAQMKELLTTRLAEVDTNGDGLLSKAEATGPFERRFDDSDTNGDGQLNATEQQAMMAAMEERMGDGGGRGGFGRGGGGGGDRGDRGRGRRGG